MTKSKGQLTDVEIRMLRIFKAVVECGGFSAAEVELNIGRAAISISMADLEARVGLRLCQRGRAGFSLTEEGRQVYEYTLQLFSSLADFRTRVNALHDKLKGELNIGITDNLVTIPHMRVTNALSALKEQGPDVTINIRMSPPNEIELGVLDGRLHIGVVPELRPLAGLDYLPLYHEESHLYCSHQHPLSNQQTESIEQAELHRYDAVVPAYAQTPEIKRLHQQLTASATASDREGIAFLILTGQFIGYLPDHFAQRWIRDGQMKTLLPQALNYLTLFSAITRKGRRDNLVLETYLNQLKAGMVRVGSTC